MRYCRLAATLTLAGSLILVDVGAGARAEQAAPWPTRIEAHYSLHFTGFGQLGKLHYQSQFMGNDYTISGNAEVKIPLIYNWSSKVSGSGRISGNEAQPAAYSFTSQGKPVIGGTKTASVRLGLKDRSVTLASVIPPNKTEGQHFVPLQAEHMKQVIDPLTAVIAMTRSNGSQPCGRKLSVFDGKQRYDLTTTAAGQQKVPPEKGQSGQPVTGYLCKVKYQPVAGFKDTEDFRNLVNGSSAEIALRPVPSVNLMVPYRVTVTTKWGTATMNLQRMDIVTPGQEQIALVH